MLLGVSASRRIWGNCETAVKSVLLSARRSGAQTAFIRLTDIPIEPCRGCFRCLAEGGTCPGEDGLYDLLCHIRSVDTLVLAAPVYFMAPPAKLIALLDRLLVAAGLKKTMSQDRQAVTITIMGNRRWRGIAEPFVNMVVSLLGFRIVDSLSLVAEGPGEIIMEPAIASRLEEIGRALARSGDIETPEGRADVCPVCRSDFFTIEPPSIVCPVCGLRGDLETYTRENRFVETGGELRWGTDWLHGHIDAWVRPSVARYRANRKRILKNLHRFREQYAVEEERGKADVQ